VYEYFAQLYPQKLRAKLFKNFDYFILPVRKEFAVGTILFFSFMLALSVSLQFSKILLAFLPSFLALILMFVASFIFFQVFTYSLISMSSTKKGQFIENILPDALQLISANLRAGMTIDRALMAATRPEFGSFNDQFLIVGKEITTGTRVSDALLNMTKRVNSERFEKAMQLIVTGMSSGGELSRLLSEVAEHLVHQRTLEQKVKTSVSTYLIFIGAAVGFAAPILYGLSTTIVTIIVDTFSSVDMPTNSNVPFSIEMSEATASFLPAFVKDYTFISIVTLAIMASFLLGLIKKGSPKFGLSYVPFLIGFGLFMYYTVAWASDALFSSIV